MNTDKLNKVKKEEYDCCTWKGCVNVCMLRINLLITRVNILQEKVERLEKK